MPRHAVVGLLLVLAAGRADAGPLPVGWSYRNPLNEFAFADGASGGITFPNTVFQSILGDGEIVASRVASYSIAPDTDPDAVKSLPYRFALEVRDDLSGEVASLSFAGTLTGDLWRTGSALGNRFAGPAVQTADLGGNRYTVSLGAFTAPTGYGDDAAGAIGARVSITDIPAPLPAPVLDSPSPASPAVNTPEPATALLTLIGLPVIAVVRRSLRTRTVKSPVTCSARPS